MKLATGALLLILIAGKTGTAQTVGTPNLGKAETSGSVVAGRVDEAYTVFGATLEQEAALRAQIQQMRPEVLPNGIVFVPHWKYLDNARIFRLHVPTGYASVMFTHLPSRTVFIDNDRYLGEEWLGHWMAHELGHLALNSPKEDDAERMAKKFRVALKAGHKKS